MADMPKPIGIDTTGCELLTEAVLKLLEQYPGLDKREILFEELEKSSGIAFFADNGALVMAERKTITGKIWQTCQYPFYIVRRKTTTVGRYKMVVQDYLDSIGKWLCQEPAKVNGEYIQLTEYPDLSQGRKITRVTRLNSYALEPTEEGVQDWILPVTVQYTNEIEPIRKGV